MSLDNILAVGGAAHGDLWLLLFGLALSIPILLLGSDLVARLLGRLPILVYVGAFVLVFTAVGMFFEDEIVHDFYEAPPAVIGLVTIVASLLILLLARRGRATPAPAHRTQPSGSHQ